eukprot:g1883.t1
MRYATMTIVDTDAEDKDVGGEDATKNAVREDTVTLPIFFNQDNEDEDTPDLASLAFDVRRRFLACFPPNVFRKDLLRQDQIESLLGKIRKYRSKKRATSRRLADKEKKKMRKEREKAIRDEVDRAIELISKNAATVVSASSSPPKKPISRRANAIESDPYDEESDVSAVASAILSAILDRSGIKHTKSPSSKERALGCDGGGDNMLDGDLSSGYDTDDFESVGEKATNEEDMDIASTCEQSLDAHESSETSYGGDVDVFESVGEEEEIDDELESNEKANASEGRRLDEIDESAVLTDDDVVDDYDGEDSIRSSVSTVVEEVLASIEDAGVVLEELIVDKDDHVRRNAVDVSKTNRSFEEGEEEELNVALSSDHTTTTDVPVAIRRGDKDGERRKMVLPLPAPASTSIVVEKDERDSPLAASFVSLVESIEYDTNDFEDDETSERFAGKIPESFNATSSAPSVTSIGSSSFDDDFEAEEEDEQLEGGKEDVAKATLEVRVNSTAELLETVPRRVPLPSRSVASDKTCPESIDERSVEISRDATTISLDKHERVHCDGPYPDLAAETTFMRNVDATMSRMTAMHEESLESFRAAAVRDRAECQSERDLERTRRIDLESELRRLAECTRRAAEEMAHMQASISEDAERSRAQCDRTEIAAIEAMSTLRNEYATEIAFLVERQHIERGQLLQNSRAEYVQTTRRLEAEYHRETEARNSNIRGDISTAIERVQAECTSSLDALVADRREDSIEKEARICASIAAMEHEHVEVMKQASERAARASDVSLSHLYEEIEAVRALSSETASGVQLSLKDLGMQRDEALRQLGVLKEKLAYATSRLELRKQIQSNAKMDEELANAMRENLKLAHDLALTERDLYGTRDETSMRDVTSRVLRDLNLASSMARERPPFVSRFCS